MLQLLVDEENFSFEETYQFWYIKSPLLQQTKTCLKMYLIV